MRLAVPLGAFLALLALAWLVHAAGPAKAIQLLHLPNFVMAPATIRVQVRTLPIASDRCVVVLADNGDFYRRSDWSIDGLNAAHLSPPLELRDIPPGEYVIVAGIGSDVDHGCEHVRARDEGRLTVIGH